MPVHEAIYLLKDVNGNLHPLRGDILLEWARSIGMDFPPTKAEIEVIARNALVKETEKSDG